MATHVLTGANFLYGFGSGQTFVDFNNREREVKQGKNYLIASSTHLIQYSYVADVFKQIMTQLQGASWPLSIGCFVAPILALPFGLFAAGVKQGVYEGWAQDQCTKKSFIAPFLPKNLSAKTVQLLGFYAEHIGTVLRVAMLVGAVALLYLGSYALGAGLVGAFVYQQADIHGLVPLSVRIFMETYVPYASSAAMLVLGGSLLIQIGSLLHLISAVPSVNKFLSYKEDEIIRKFLSAQDASLAEYEAPLVKPLLTQSEMDKIFKGKDEDFEINPAHCSKWATGTISLPEDRDFKKLLPLFEGVNLGYAQIRNKLKDDEQFKALLLKEFPKRNITKDFDELILDLAQRQNKSVEKYAEERVSNQMKALVMGLTGEKRMEGTAQDCVDSQNIFAKILPYVDSLPRSSEKEDLILRIAVEAGDYCARGVKGTGNEILHETVLRQGWFSKNLKDKTPLEIYEMQIEQALQNQRLRTIEAGYDAIKKELLKAGITDTITGDIHGFDMYRQTLSLGFYPMTESDRAEVDLNDLYAWNMFSTLRSQMKKLYLEQMDATIKELDETKFTAYIGEKIDRDFLNAKYDEASDLKWSVKETNHRLHRLMLVSLGVLRRR